MERYPVIGTAGGSRLGDVGGEMAGVDPAWHGWMGANFHMSEGKPALAGVHLEFVAGLIGAALVVLVGKLLARRRLAASGETQEIGR